MARNILIIDDEWAIQQALKARLSAHGYSITMAGDGPSGIIAAQEHRPDVILLDLRMPDIDGLEILRILRSKPDTSSIPVIFLTANIQDTVKQQARSAGAAGFLTKPYEASEVLDAILATAPKSAACSADEELCNPIPARRS